jgi:hypothetical protein
VGPYEASTLDVSTLGFVFMARNGSNESATRRRNAITQ